MTKTILRAAAAAAVTLLSAGLAAAQATTAPPDPAKVKAEIDKAIEAFRKDARAGKADVLGKTMQLDSTQAAAFWPIYKQYEAEAKVLGDERLGIIKDFAAQYDTLDDAKAKALLDRQVALEDKKLALQKKYKDEMLKALPAKTVARFLQVDSRLNKLVELMVASEIPLVY
jgi:Spy/CpxP family protein refolding chaperone